MKDDETYVTEVKVDPNTNEYYVEFASELMESLHWSTGDTLEWIDNNDGSFMLRKKGNDEV